MTSHGSSGGAAARSRPSGPTISVYPCEISPNAAPATSARMTDTPCAGAQCHPGLSIELLLAAPK